MQMLNNQRRDVIKVFCHGFVFAVALLAIVISYSEIDTIRMLYASDAEASGVAARVARRFFIWVGVSAFFLGFCGCSLFGIFRRKSSSRVEPGNDRGHLQPGSTP